MIQEFPAVSWTRALTEIGVVLRLGDAEAEAMLDDACRQKAPRCMRCGHDKIYALSGKRLLTGSRMRCAKCRYSFRQFTGRWLGRHRLPAKVWLAAIKCFELGLGAKELAQVAGLSLPTAMELERTLHLSLAATDPAWTKAVVACATGHNPPTAFRVRERGNGVKVDIIPDAEGTPRIELPPAETASNAVRIFRAGARRWMRLPADRLPLKLKELEYRSRGGSIFELLLEALVRPEPSGMPEPQEAPETHGVAEELVAA